MSEPGQHDGDAERLRQLDERIARHRAAQEPAPRAPVTGLGQANMAWRMIVELVTGLLIGFGIGYGLDWLFGTGPLFLVLFVLFGFAAGVNVMLRTAKELSKEVEAEAETKAKEKG